MFSRLTVSYLIFLFLAGNTNYAAPWDPRANTQEQQRGSGSKNSLPMRGSAAYFGIKPATSENVPLHSSVQRAALDNRKTPSSRGRGGTSTARVNIHQTPGEKLREQQVVRYGFLTEQRNTVITQENVELYRTNPYTFSLDPNPTFKPFILQSEWEKNDKYEFKLWNPYSGGYFYQFGQEKD